MSQVNSEKSKLNLWNSQIRFFSDSEFGWKEKKILIKSVRKKSFFRLENLAPFGLKDCLNNGEVYKQSTAIACINKKSQIKYRNLFFDISQNPQKGKERLSGGFVLCLSGHTDPPPLFYMSSSGALRLEVISQKSRKGKGRLPGISVLCLSPQGQAPPLFYMSSSGGLPLEVISQNPQKGKERLSGGFVLCLSGQTDPPPLFYNQLVIFTFFVVVVHCPLVGLSTRSL